MAWAAWFGMISLDGLVLLLMLPYAPQFALNLPAVGFAFCGALHFILQ